MKEKTNFKKLPLSLKITLISVMIIAICFLYLMGSLYYRSVTSGKAIGSSIGDFEGDILGNIEAYLDGRKNGEEAGKNATDVAITLGNDIALSGELQVQSINFEYIDKAQIGEESAQLNKYTARIVYSVDLSSVKPSYNNDTVYIPIQNVKGTIEIAPNVEQLDSWYKNSNTGSTQNGLETTLANDTKVRAGIIDELSKDDASYGPQAIVAAKEQVQVLVKAMLMDDRTVEVIIKEDKISYGK